MAPEHDTPPRGLGGGSAPPAGPFGGQRVPRLPPLRAPGVRLAHVPKAFVQPVREARPGTPEARIALVAALQEHVRTRLGRYAYPQQVVFVEDFERTEAGKIRKAALREP